MWKGRTQAEIAAAFTSLFPEAGAPVDPRASTSLLLQEADAARRIAAVYWPGGFAKDMNFDFECVVYESYDTNAFSAFRGGVHWTGISTGLLYALAELAFRVAATFPLDGGNEPPVVLKDAIGAGFRYREADFQHDTEMGQRLFKQAEAFGMTRMRLMNTIWLDAQTLIWRHELFHATLGHTRYLDANLGLSSIDEIAHGLSFAGQGDEDVKALEFHADWAAFGSVLHMALSDMDPAGSDLTRRIGATGRAAALMTAILLLPIFLKVGEERGILGQSSHPSAAARMTIFLTRVEEISDEAQRQVYRDGVSLALRGLLEIGRTEPDFAILRYLFNDEAFAAATGERIACIDRFDELQPELIPYALLPLGHPHQGGIDPLDVDLDDDEEDGSSA